MTARLGIIIVGSEILLGKREDRHFARSRAQALGRGYELAWSLLLADRWEDLINQYRWAFAQECPFFSFGGLGATPDDLTRAAAAAALDLSLERHPEAARLIRERFGDGAEPIRIRMADLPKGASIIPNPVNQIPGFQLLQGYFFPGFPQMAEPMSQWILERDFPLCAPALQLRILLREQKESDWVDFMERLCAEHAQVEFSSLPSFSAGGTQIELGLRGEAPSLRAAWQMLATELERRGVRWEWLEEPQLP
ncbi:molybdopterin-binding protein [Acidithiobacillus sp. AMEEHan]|uniref:competence/damage-inducible protein A n=1 Tax=Acidithiobacillus sp. AMEEHan TaxID=2994951 RepID=UPI0027E3E490|nr:molybdopterin-binding protein [Acidithiobacillus sp. AMEEHan]